MRFVLALGSLIASASVSCMPPASSKPPQNPADASRGELAARPKLKLHGNGTSGVFELQGDGGQPTLLYVPEAYSSDQPISLVVMLHGAGGAARHSLEMVQRHADQLNFIVVAPQSRGATWDVIAGRRYGPDVTALDKALEQVFSLYSVDPQRVAIAGFSDGASYALSLGLTNGELFRSVLAFSPGFMQPTRQQGRPRIFISHGTKDRVLPIDQCSRRIVPQLRSAGYTVDYREFPDGHIVPEELALSAFKMLN